MQAEGETMLVSTRLVWTMLILTASCLAQENSGDVFLEIWPSARSTSLAGAMVALADDPDAAYWNPGGLAFQKGLGFTGTTGHWLPGLWPGMTYSFGSIDYGLPILSNRFAATFGLNTTWLNLGKYYSFQDGQAPDAITDVDRAVGLQAGFRLFRTLGIGFGFKQIRQYDVLATTSMESTLIEVENDVAVDLGVLCKPVRYLSVGAALDNLGPDFRHEGLPVPVPLPEMLRIGVCYTPFDQRAIRTRFMLQTDGLLVGEFYWPMTPAAYWAAALQDAWKSAATEVTLCRVVSFRIGYFEDINDAQGGLVFEQPDGETQHYSLGDVLFGKTQGRFHGVGLCLGMGVGYKDYVRVDISSDAMIYDFPTSNTKIALTVNDLLGMVHDIRSSK
jgi:hypothetical protein